MAEAEIVGSDDVSKETFSAPELEVVAGDASSDGEEGPFDNNEGKSSAELRAQFQNLHEADSLTPADRIKALEAVKEARRQEATKEPFDGEVRKAA